MTRTTALVLAAALLLTGCAGTPSASEPSGSRPSAASVVTVQGTIRPELSWPELGASTYLIGIVTESGASWAWEGETTSVVVGGAPAVDWIGPGFALESAATLTFAAFDDDGDRVHLEVIELPAP